MKKIKLLLAAMAVMVGMGVNAQTWTGNAVANGTFYLYNVAAQKFLNNGDPLQNWGTNAYLQAGFGLDVVIAEAGEGVYTIDTNISNGGNDHYLNNSTWCDKPAVNWTFRAVEGETNTYQIIYDGQYLMATENLNDVEMVSDPGSRTTSTYWKLVSEDDFKAAMVAKTYSATEPMDVSVFIKGRSFARNDGRNSSWTTTHNGGNWVWIGGSDNKYYGNEAWNNTFDVHQAIADLPDGTYEVQCSGFGTNGTTYVYGNSTTGQLQTDNSTSWGNNKEAKWKAIHEDNAFAGQTTGKFTLSGGNLTVGIKRETNKGSDWAVWDEFRLYYYGLDLSEFAATLANAVSEAEALAGIIPVAAYDALAAVVAEQNKTYTTAADYTAAAEAIAEATNTAKAMVAPYAAYKTIAENAPIAGVASETISAQNVAVEEATTVAEIEACIATLQAAIDALAFDITTFTITNPTAQTKDGWEGTDFGGQSDGVCEYWNVSPAGFYQTISLPAGTYRLTVTALQRTGMTGTVYVDNKSTIIAQVASNVVNNRSQAASWFNAGNGVNTVYFTAAEAGDFVIGLKADETTGDHWTVWKSFKLETFQESIAADYLAPGFATLVESAQATLDDAAYANVTGEERTNLETAITATPSTIAEYEAAVEAINNAVAAFKAAKADYDKYVAYKNETIALFGSDLNVAAPTSAAAADDAIHALNIAQYNKVAAEYTFSATGLIGDFGSWTGTATVAGNPATPNYLAYEHWSGQTHAYYEQASNGWGSQSGWTIKYEKTCTLPAGSYVIKVAARSSAGTTSKVSCTATGTTISLPNAGASARGIKLNGEAGWDGEDSEYARDGVGFGWQWRFLPFKLTEQTEVTMTFYAEATTQYQWMSIADGELLSTTKLAQDVAYNETESNAIVNTIIADVTMTRNIKEGFNTVCLPFTLTANQVAAAFGTGTEVYAFSENSDNYKNVTINFNKGDGSITANVPVLVKATQASTEQVFEGVQIVAPTDDPAVHGSNVSFVGIYAPITVADGDYFISNSENALCQSAGNTSLKAFRAYIDATEDVEIKMFVGGEEVATGIEEINGQWSQSDAIYNLAGQRISKMQKGINIVNGKKILK